MRIDTRDTSRVLVDRHGSRAVFALEAALCALGMVALHIDIRTGKVKRGQGFKILRSVKCGHYYLGAAPSATVRPKECGNILQHSSGGVLYLKAHT